MPFTNILPTTSIILPSGGSQTAGSGTVVFGANNADGTLPPELVSAYGANASAIIWYSGANNSSRLIYYFLIYNDFAGYMGEIALGYLPVGLGTTIQITAWLGEFGSGKRSMVTNPDLYGSALDVSSGTGGPVVAAAINAEALRLYSFANNVGATLAGGTSPHTLAHWRSDGVTSYLTDDSTFIDTWQSGAISGTNWTGNVDYRISYDRICEVRLQVTFTVAPATGLLTLSAIMPVAARPTVSTHSYPIAGTYTASSGTSGVSQTIPSTGDVKFLGTASQLVFQTNFTYQVPKPTY